MASRLIELKEAAKMLRITADELADMRSRNEVYGYRDGQTWKFKIDEIERIAAEKGIDLAPADGPSVGAGSGIDQDLDEMFEVSEIGGDPDSILVSEEELGDSGESTASTIIGKDSAGSSADSDISLVADDGGSDVRLVAGGSDILSENEGGDLGPSDTADLAPEDVPEIDANELSLDDDDLSLGEDDLDLDLDSGESGVDLDADDLVLDSGIGSDVTKNPSGSGIGLAAPSDVGIDLGGEEAAELSPSSVEALELGPADDVLEMDEIADPAAATQLNPDDDFLLTPVEDLTGDESDSGSQVIALDTEEFDESADTLLSQGAGDSPFLEDEADLLDGGANPLGAAAAPLTIEQPTEEAPYSVWCVLGLLMCVLTLGFTGMLMYELVRNIWSWDGAHPIPSKMAEAVINLFAK